MSADFETALAVVLAHEGGFVDHPDDPGGRTIYGISERAHPDAWRDGPPSLDAAQAIYRVHYWDRLGLGHVQHQAVATKLLDLGVNLGVRQAALLWQRALKAAGETVVVDGIVGPNTLRATGALRPTDLLAHLKVTVARFYLDLWQAKPKERTAFARGWLARALS